MAIENKIRELAASYAKELQSKLETRIEEMKEDDKSHFLIYQVLGISNAEGELIDVYQNKGRFLYNYAGLFLEEATYLCFKEVYPNANRLRIKNLESSSPKEFESWCNIFSVKY